MDELIRVITEWLAYFFIKDRYIISHKEVGESFDDAFVEFNSDLLKWRLINDRSQIILICCSMQESYKEWYSIDLLFKLLSGKWLESGVLTEEMAEWIDNNLNKIEYLFTYKNMFNTREEMKKLKKIRAKAHNI